MRGAASGSADRAFDGSAAKPAANVLVVADAPALREPGYVHKQALAFHTSDLLPAERIAAPRPTKKSTYKDGLKTLGTYTAAVGVGLAFGGVAAAWAVFSAGIALFVTGFAI